MLQSRDDDLAHGAVVARPQHPRREVAEGHQLIVILLGALAARPGQESKQDGQPLAEKPLVALGEQGELRPADAGVLHLVGEVPVIEPSELGMNDAGPDLLKHVTADRLGHAAEGDSQNAIAPLSGTGKLHPPGTACLWLARVGMTEAQGPVPAPQTVAALVLNRAPRPGDRPGRFERTRGHPREAAL